MLDMDIIGDIDNNKKEIIDCIKKYGFVREHIDLGMQFHRLGIDRNKIIAQIGHQNK